MPILILLFIALFVLSCGREAALNRAVASAWNCEPFTSERIDEIRYRVSGCDRTGVFDCMIDYQVSKWRRTGRKRTPVLKSFVCAEIPPELQ